MKRIKKILFVILSGILGLIFIFNLYNFISLKVLHKSLATVNGYALLEVVSGSMEPTIKKGDMIIINTKNKNIKENDIITFIGNEGEFVTHRIKVINEDGIITKGDNNNTEDKPINKSAIVGKYVTKINNMGAILSSLKSPFTLVMIFVIGVLICFLLSTDSDGNPVLDSDEAEFQKFLQEKENKKEIVEPTTKKSSKATITKLETKKVSAKANETKDSNKKIVKKSSNVSKPKVATKKETTSKTNEVKKEVVPKKTLKASTKSKETVAKTKAETKNKTTTPKSVETVSKEVKKPSTKSTTKKTTNKKKTTSK